MTLPIVSGMPRQPRYFVPGIPQHVLTRGVDRKAVFFTPGDRKLYLNALAEAAEKYGCAVHAYVLMTNHVHLLMTPDRDNSVPLVMQAMGRLYVQRLNKLYLRTGTLWEGRYKASLVQDDRYLFACQRYIELNPVRAGIVSVPDKYPWSSYGCNALGNRDSLVTQHQLYQDLDTDPVRRQQAYRNMFGDALSTKELSVVRDTTNACLILGNERFKDQIENLLGRSVRHGKSGRPKKISS